MAFDKILFADLLKRAKGDRSINRFGHETNVDPGYISRLLRCRLANPPSAVILSRIAEKASNDVTISELMIAAGYMKSFSERDIKEAEINNLPTKQSAIDNSEADAWPSFLKAMTERPRLSQVFDQLKELSDDKLLRVLKMIKMIREMGD
ncbi:MAG: hypothetical protein ABSC17_04850 [Thermacetogeniaceae bacterium]